MAKVKIKRGDNVIVTTGKNKGSKGEVLEVIKKENADARVIVAGVNVVKKHVKPSASNPQGGIVEKEASINISNVSLVDANGKATKVAYKVEGDKKVRIAKTTGKENLIMEYVARPKKLYTEKIVPAMMEEFGYKSIMQVPKLEKIVVSQGLGAATADKKIVDYAVEELTAITGQKQLELYLKKTRQLSN